MISISRAFLDGYLWHCAGLVFLETPRLRGRLLDGHAFCHSCRRHRYGCGASRHFFDFRVRPLPSVSLLHRFAVGRLEARSGLDLVGGCAYFPRQNCGSGAFEGSGFPPLQRAGIALARGQGCSYRRLSSLTSLTSLRWSRAVCYCRDELVTRNATFGIWWHACCCPCCAAFCALCPWPSFS